MDKALTEIAKRRAAFSELPFFSFLRDTRLSAADRLVFAPAGAPFIMAFADLNRHILYVADSDDPLQKLINVHSYEDATHFEMYLSDLDVLGHNPRQTFTQTLRFLWSEERKSSRRTCYDLAALLSSASTPLRIVIVEAIEAMGAVAFRAFGDVGDQYQALTGKALRYFGRPHEALESGHTMGTDDIEIQLSTIVLTDDEAARARELVETVFRAFSDMMDELHGYARRVLTERSATGRLANTAGAPA